ncbi:MAG: hypothetical protein ACRETF_00040 [Nevskiaceae bacterium]
MSLPRRTFAACLLVCASGVALGASSRPIVEPDPVSVPAGTSTAAVAKAIKRALLGRDWTVSNEKPGYMEGTLNVRKHMVKVGISYDGKRVAMKYLDSAELGYKESGGEQYIHPKYTQWTRNVMIDVNKNLQVQDSE